MNPKIRAEDFIKALNDKIQTALESCVAQGFVLPLHFALLATNGSCYLVRAAADGRTILAQHTKPEGVKMPLSMLVVDARGDSATLRVEMIDGPIKQVH